jgi:hypothetical protein
MQAHRALVVRCRGDRHSLTDRALEVDRLHARHDDYERNDGGDTNQQAASDESGSYDNTLQAKPNTNRIVDVQQRPRHRNSIPVEDDS